MRKDELPVYQHREYVRDLLKREGEPTRGTFTLDHFQKRVDGSIDEVWIGVSKWTGSHAWSEQFDSMIDCLVWLTKDDDEYESPAAQEDIDEMMESLWEAFGEYTIDDEERIEEPFLRFAAGAKREDVWHWFDEWYSKGVHALLYGDDDPEQEARKTELDHALAQFYAEAEEEREVYVCYLLCDTDNCVTHTEDMEVFRCLIDAMPWWLDEEAALVDQGMAPREEDDLAWNEVRQRIESGSQFVSKAMYEWIGKEYDPMNCVQIIVEKHELK